MQHNLRIVGTPVMHFFVETEFFSIYGYGFSLDAGHLRK
jgi:hypothetical protein